MKRHESSEDYLETILLLQQKLGAVRSIDIAAQMGFSKPSVSVAMKNLRGKDLIATDESGYIVLTAAGKSLAERVYERHTVLVRALTAIGVSEETAKLDACRIEHDISEETFAQLKKFVEATAQ